MKQKKFFAPIVRAAFFFFALFFVGDFLWAEPRHALLIANNKYEALSNLGTPVKEARDLKKVLERLNFKVILVENASLKKMSDSIIDFEDLLKEGGIGFFHYGGHAVQVNGRNYLIPIDADIPNERKVASRAVDVDEVMTSMVADTNIVVLDACRNNPLPAGEGRSASRGLIATGRRPKNSIIIYSAQAGSVATDGVFTPQLIKHLEEKKEFTAIMREVRGEVSSMTNGDQMPGEYSQLVSSVYLNGKPPVQENGAKTRPEWVNSFFTGDAFSAKKFREKCPSLKVPDGSFVFFISVQNKDLYSLEKQADFECVYTIRDVCGSIVSQSVQSHVDGKKTTESVYSLVKIGNEFAFVYTLCSSIILENGESKFRVQLKTPKGVYDVYDNDGKFILPTQANSWMNFAFNQAYPNMSQTLKKIADYKEYDNETKEWKYSAVFCVDENAMKKDIAINCEKDVMSEDLDEILEEFGL